MAESKIGKQYEIKSATTQTITVSANGTQDVEIPFSSFDSSRNPVAISGFGYSGTGYSYLMAYKMVIDYSTSKILISVRNNRTSDASAKVIVYVLFA